MVTKQDPRRYDRSGLSIIPIPASLDIVALRCLEYKPEPPPIPEAALVYLASTHVYHSIECRNTAGTDVQKSVTQL